MKKKSAVCIFIICSLMFSSCANFSSADSYLGNVYTKPTVLTKVNRVEETAAETIYETETEKIEASADPAESETEKIERNIYIEEDPNAVKYVITENGKKFHRDSCKSVKSIKQIISYDNAVQLGYDPCKICNPVSG